jgi:excinuclease ABC subunit A
VSSSGKSSLVSQALVELVSAHWGSVQPDAQDDLPDALQTDAPPPVDGRIVQGAHAIQRLVQVDQKPIGPTTRSNLATYTGLFDAVRKLFAATPAARRRRYDSGRFSFNLTEGRCATCKGEGFVSVELLFMPSVYSPCPVCQGARYNPQTLEVTWQGKNVAEVLRMTVDEATAFFAGQSQVLRALVVLQNVGLRNLRLGQPATELSGGEAQRIKLATKLQRDPRGKTLYVLDEPATGLHPADVDQLMAQLNRLVDAGNTVLVVEREMRIVAQSDWVIDIGPCAGEKGGTVVAKGTPQQVAASERSRTATYLAACL